MEKVNDLSLLTVFANNKSSMN